jgi:hypothetical protein
MIVGRCRPETQLIVFGLASLIVIGWAAYAQNRALALGAAIVFCASAIASGHKLSKTPSVEHAAAFQMLQKSVCLSIVTCAWAAAALFLAYPIAGLKWLHGWEYGVAFALITVLFSNYARLLESYIDTQTQAAAVARAKALAVLQAIAIAVTMIWIIASGKLATVKGDWLANDIFLATGFAMLTLSMLLVRSLNNSEA